MTTREIVVGNGQLVSSTYTWEINNYSSYSDLETSECIRSPTFYALNSLWFLSLYPNGMDITVSECISLLLVLEKTELAVGQIQVQFSFACLDSRKEVIATVNTRQMFAISEQQGGGKLKFVDKSLLANNASDNMLNKITIVCEVIVKGAKLYKQILMATSDRMQHFPAFENLVNSQKFSDVKFKIQNQEIFAHKVVLAASSVVFDAMFEHEMLENMENVVTIEDISYKVLHELLSFVYTGKCTLSEDIVSELFKAADKYQLLKLKDMCEEELGKGMSVNNVVSFLQLADMHSAKRLKKEAIDFIAIHGKEIINKPEFDLLKNVHPELFKDVFREVFTRIN